MIAVRDGSVLWGRDYWAAKYRPELHHFVDAAAWQGRLARAAEAGIEIVGGLACPFPSAPHRDFSEANTELAAATGPSGPATSLDAVFAVRPNDSASLEGLDRAIAARTVVGVKLWPYMAGFSVEDVLRDEALIARIVENRIMLLIHVGNGREIDSRPAFPPVRATPDTALTCAKALPEVPVIIAHVARLCDATISQLSDCPNVYLDTSGLTSLGRWQEAGRDGLSVNNVGVFQGMGPARILQCLASELGLADRLIFGTTWPFCCWWGVDIEEDVAFIRSSDLDATQQNAILSRNLERLLKSRGSNGHDGTSTDV